VAATAELGIISGTRGQSTRRSACKLRLLVSRCTSGYVALNARAATPRGWTNSVATGQWLGLTLLHNMGQLVRHQPVAFGAAGLIPRRVKGDLGPRGVSECAERTDGSGGFVVGADADPAEIEAEAGLEPGASGSVESASAWRMAGRIGAHSSFPAAVNLGHAQDPVSDVVGFLLERIVDRPDGEPWVGGLLLARRGRPADRLAGEHAHLGGNGPCGNNTILRLRPARIFFMARSSNFLPFLLRKRCVDVQNKVAAILPARCDDEGTRCSIGPLMKCTFPR
jgi:hypothetical protein